jgi:hypothetical protein
MPSTRFWSWGSCRAASRSPFLQIEGEQRGSEDVTGRIVPLGDSTFLFVLEQNDHDTDSDAAASARSAWILLIDTALAVRDTVAVLPGTPTFPRTVSALAGFPLFEQPLYSSRPVVASGHGWYAIGHGEMSHVEIRNSTGAPIARVQWPDVRSDIGAGERREGAEWELALRIINSSRAAELYRDATSWQRSAMVEGDSEVVADPMTLEASRDCPFQQSTSNSSTKARSYATIWFPCSGVYAPSVHTSHRSAAE